MCSHVDNSFEFIRLTRPKEGAGVTVGTFANINPQTKLEMEVAKLLEASGNSNSKQVMHTENKELMAVDKDGFQSKFILAFYYDY